ncbi:MAG: tRNA (adenosine(37)-N6)-threonylcarbamoyltransferase complex ATPase subunit type 1 TsaE [Candidatus Cyclobacteriaceae bacterium M3_2C_046]
MRLEVKKVEELLDTAKKIIEFANDQKVWLFEGDLGAGKTTLIKAICEMMEVDDVVNSPTFSIVNEYNNKKGEILYHLDFYRLKNDIEALDIGIDEYISSGRYCFIEWPSRIENLLPQENLSIKIDLAANGSRMINLVKND